jgi:DNA-binding transcriptional LysR family regulator
MFGDWARISAQSRELRPQRFYDHFYLLIQAAACGLGVAMVPKILVLDDLRSNDAGDKGRPVCSKTALAGTSNGRLALTAGPWPDT